MAVGVPDGNRVGRKDGAFVTVAANCAGVNVGAEILVFARGIETATTGNMSIPSNPCHLKTSVSNFANSDRAAVMDEPSIEI